jgi:hypothetical protein
MTMETNLDKNIQLLYIEFSLNTKPNKDSFCSHCYNEDDINLLNSIGVDGLDFNLGRRLLWDLNHHDLSAIKYFFPRLLESMCPPNNIYLLSYKQFFTDLYLHNFLSWKANEIKSTLSFFDNFTNYKRLKLEDELETFNGKRQTYEEACADFSVPLHIDQDDWLKWNEEFEKFNELIK